MDHNRLAVGMLAAAICLTGCGKGAPKQGPAALNVDVATAHRQDIGTSITLDGQIAPLEQSTLAFQQSGPIAAVYVNVGDRVRQGELVAKIDDSTLRAQLAQAQAAAAQQNASAQGAQAGLPIAQQQNSAAVQTAQAALANARLVYNQDEALFKQGYVSQAQLESARSQYVQAQNQYNNAQIGLRNNVVSAQSVRAAAAGAQAAQAQAGVLQTEIGQTTLYAPFDGVVTQRMIDPGAMATPATPVVAVSRVDTVWININVPDENLPFVRSGTHVTFTSSSLPGKTFSANVNTVNAVPTSGTLSYLARIQRPNPGDLLRGGMLVTATLPKESHKNAIVVPRTAVAQTEKGNAVYIVNGDKAVEVPIRVGIQTDTLAEVMSSRIQPGTKVITTRPDALKDGSVVAVNSANGSAPAGQGGSTQQ